MGGATLAAETQLSLSHILSNGLVFFTALIIRDYLQSNVSIIPIHHLPVHDGVLKFLKLAITLVIVAALLVIISNWKKDVAKTLHREEQHSRYRE